MHCVFIGIVKKLCWFWFDSENYNHPSSLSRFLAIINKRLLAITPSNYVPRLPRSIADFAYWKASELKLFLLIYSIPILSDLMKEKYLNHHKLLVFSIYLLSQPSVALESIEKASQMLNEYVLQYAHLYGDRHMSMNLHLLLHLPTIVKRFGPLWVTSCFSFENMNGILKSLIHGTKYAELQICSSVSYFFNYSELKKKIFN